LLFIGTKKGAAAVRNDSYRAFAFGFTQSLRWLGCCNWSFMLMVAAPFLGNEKSRKFLGSQLCIDSFMYCSLIFVSVVILLFQPKSLALALLYAWGFNGNVPLFWSLIGLYSYFKLRKFACRCVVFL
jgi:hypothetical protein